MILQSVEHHNPRQAVLKQKLPEIALPDEVRSGSYRCSRPTRPRSYLLGAPSCPAWLPGHFFSRKHCPRKTPMARSYPAAQIARDNRADPIIRIGHPALSIPELHASMRARFYPTTSYKWKVRLSP